MTLICSLLHTNSAKLESLCYYHYYFGRKTERIRVDAKKVLIRSTDLYRIKRKEEEKKTAGRRNLATIIRNQ